MTKIKSPSPRALPAEDSPSPVAEKETTHGVNVRDDPAVDGVEEQGRPSLEQRPVTEAGGLKQPLTRSSKSAVGKAAPEPAGEDAEELQTLGLPSAGWLVDSLFAMAFWAVGKKFRPGRSIDLMPHFTPKEHDRLKEIAAGVKDLEEARRYPLIAHLIGIGGEMDFILSETGLPAEISLEGLSRDESKDYLSRILREVTVLTRSLLGSGGSEGHGTAAQWDEVLEDVSECWEWENDLGQLEFRVFDDSPDEDPVSELEVVSADWGISKGLGHAVGFVYALEDGERYLYACNTGVDSDFWRTIVKYSINDEKLFKRFLLRGDRESSRVKELWTVGPDSLGLSRCPESEQIPPEIERSSQKRGNCPIASRKSCQLAMLWSLGKKKGLSPREIKTVYKVITTLIRSVGVQAALVEGNPELLGRTLVSMISKWDRPDCRRQALQVADALLMKYYGEETPGLDYANLPLDVLNSDASVLHIKAALDVAEIQLRDIRTGRWDLVNYARLSDNTEVVALLRRLEF